MKRHGALLLGACGLALLTALPAAALPIIYSNDFESSATASGGTWSSPTVSSYPTSSYPTAASDLGLGSKFLGPFVNKTGSFGTVSLTLDNVPAANVTVSFGLIIGGSWDGNTSAGGIGPDRFTFAVGSATLLDTTFSNDVGKQTGAIEKNQLGFLSTTGSAGGYFDSVYLLTFTFTNPTAGSIVLNFSSKVTGSDEAFGLDNVLVTDPPPDGAVPEPSSLLLLGSGMVGAGLWRRMRRKKPGSP